MAECSRSTEAPKYKVLGRDRSQTFSIRALPISVSRSMCSPCLFRLFCMKPVQKELQSKRKPVAVPPSESNISAVVFKSHRLSRSPNPNLFLGCAEPLAPLHQLPVTKQQWPLLHRVPNTTNGTAIYADQLGWCQGGQWGGIYGSPTLFPQNT